MPRTRLTTRAIKKKDKDVDGYKVDEPATKKPRPSLVSKPKKANPDAPLRGLPMQMQMQMQMQVQQQKAPPSEIVFPR